MKKLSLGKRLCPNAAVTAWGLNLLIVLLLAALFLQCGVYIVTYTHLRETPEGTEFEMRMLSSSAQESFRLLEASFLRPEAICIRTPETCRAVLNSDVVIEEIYTALSPAIVSALIGDAKQVEETEWIQAVQAEHSLYIKFPLSLPYQLHHAFASAYIGQDARIRRAEPAVTAREMILLPNTAGSFTCLLLRGETGVYMYSVTEPLSMSAFSGYPTTYPNVFYAASLSFGAHATELHVEESVYARQIYVLEEINSLLGSNRTDMAVLLRFLDFNPDKLNYHTEGDGTQVYVESHGNLRFSSEELHYRAAEDGGIRLIGTEGEETADIFSYLSAVSYICSRLSALNAIYVGGDAVLSLCSLRAEGKNISIGFSYRADNTLLLRGEGAEVLSFTFSGDRLTELRYRMLVVSRGLENWRVPLQSWSRASLHPRGAGDMMLVYSDGGSMDTWSAAWAASAADRKDGE